MYRRTKLVRLVLALGAWAFVMLVVPSAVSLPVAVGHAQYHAILALGVLLPALALALRRGERPTIASTAPILGFAAFAAAQLVESVGGLGYGPDTDARANALVVFHDLGLAITPVGLVAALVGVSIGIGAVVARRSGRPALAATASMVLLVVGGIGVAKLLGF
jgi:hypothetical protein